MYTIMHFDAKKQLSQLTLPSVFNVGKLVYHLTSSNLRELKYSRLAATLEWFKAEERVSESFSACCIQT